MEACSSAGIFVKRFGALSERRRLPVGLGEPQ